MTLLSRFITRDLPQQVPFKATAGESVTMLGNYAKSALENPAFEAAFKKVEDSLLSTWKQSSPADETAREHIYFEIQALARVKSALVGMFNNMRIEAEIEAKKKKEQK